MLTVYFMKKHVENLFFQSICTHYMYVSICFEFDKVFA